MQTLAGDLLLLALDDDRGTVSWQRSTGLRYGLGGALLMDLAQQERITVVTHVDLMPPFVAEANKLLNSLATEARKQPGCVRYEVIVEPARRNHVAIVSVWESQAAFDKHLTQPSTRTFRGARCSIA